LPFESTVHLVDLVLPLSHRQLDQTEPVYREILASEHPTLTIYGWGLGEQDMHILDRMKGAGIESVAISVYQKRQTDCSHAAQVIAEKLGADVEVEFFDSGSEDCWIHAGNPD
jgi:50S ribosomal subunit-associated GTPase HflX